MGLTVVNVGGLDIIDGNRKMTLAIMWQLMRRHTLNLLQVGVGSLLLVSCLLFFACRCGVMVLLSFLLALSPRRDRCHRYNK